MTQPRRSSRTDGDLTATRILEVAGPLFASSGFAETTSKSIAEQAGVDLASINYHFGSRAGLYQATLADAHGRLIAIEQLREIDATDVPAADKLARFIDALVNMAFSDTGWPARLLARELLAPSSHLAVLLTREVQPKLAIVLKILGELTGLPPGDPALARCLVSVGAPCLMLVVAGSGMTSGPVHAVRQMSRADVAAHLHTFAMAGLAAIGAQQAAAPKKKKPKR